CQTPGSNTVQVPAWNFHHDSYQLSGCRTNVKTNGYLSSSMETSEWRKVTPSMVAGCSIWTPICGSEYSTQLPPVFGMWRKSALDGSSRADICSESFQSNACSNGGEFEINYCPKPFSVLSAALTRNQAREESILH